MTGQALRLRRDLAAVLDAHGLPRVTGSHTATLPAITEPGEYRLCGWATVFGAIDQEHIAVGRHIGFHPPPRTPLYWRHDETKPIGRIERLQIADRGLWIEAVTDHPLARNAGGWSVGVEIGRYEIRTSPRPHALIRTGFVTEISITDRPALREAAVLARTPATSPYAKVYDLAGQALGIIQRYVQQGALKCSA
jgi:hypothetical protein